MTRLSTAVVALGTAGALVAAPLTPAWGAVGPLDRADRGVQAVPGDDAVPGRGIAERSQGRAVVASTLPPPLAYSVISGDGSAVVRLDPRDGRVRTLAAANEQGPFLQAQAWSVAARRVFYLAERQQSASSVDSVPQQGGPPAREVVVGDEGFDISRDGRQIVFTRPEGGQPNLFIADRGGANARRLTGAGGTAPRFSQDGTRIVFSRDLRAGENLQSDLFTIGVDGRGLTRVTGRADADDGSAAFSPDGRRLLFTRLVVSRGNIDLGVYSVGVDGRGLRLVRTDAYAPDWAANGWLTYLSVSGNRPGQVVVRPPGLASRDQPLTRETSPATAVRFAR